jgi:hypothetical protein
MAKAKTAPVPKIPKSEKFAINFPTPKPDLTGKDKGTAKKMKAAITKGTQRGMARIETSLAKALDKAMTDSTWGWSDKTTIRSNGQAVKSPRNIVDTGFLRDSKTLKVTYLQTKSSLEIKYKAPYANLVHWGGLIRPYGKAGRTLVELPRRPWIEATLNGGYGIEKFDADSIINEALQEAWTEAFG